MFARYRSRHEHSAALLAFADDLTEIKARCHCGRKATMNLRLDASGRAVRDGAQVEIGGNDRYVAMCRRHFKESLSAVHAPHWTSPFPTEKRH